MTNERNVALYVDADLVEKTRELGCNLSKTFENHMITLINKLETGYAGKYAGNTSVIGSPGEIRTPVRGSKARHSKDRASP